MGAYVVGMRNTTDKYLANEEKWEAEHERFQASAEFREAFSEFWEGDGCWREVETNVHIARVDFTETGGYVDAFDTWHDDRMTDRALERLL